MKGGDRGVFWCGDCREGCLAAGQYASAPVTLATFLILSLRSRSVLVQCHRAPGSECFMVKRQRANSNVLNGRRRWRILSEIIVVFDDATTVGL